MFPILRALKDRLLNEPAFFLSTLAALAVVLADQIELPVWVSAVAVVVFGVLTRSVVDGPLTARAKTVALKRRRARAASQAGQANIGLVGFVLVVILLVLFLKAVTGSWLVFLLLLVLLLAFVF